MSKSVPGTVLVIDSDPRVAATEFIGDPGSGSGPAPDVAASYISLFDPNRSPSPIDLSIPWLTTLADNVGSGPSFFLTELNVSSVTFNNLVSVGSWQIGLKESSNHYALSFPVCTSYAGTIYDQQGTCSVINFPELTSFSGSFNSAGNFFTGFNAPNLVQLDGTISINPNGGLITNLNGFVGLRRVLNLLQISNQAALADISALYNLTLLQAALNLSFNTLSTSQVNALLIALAASLSGTSGGGQIDVSNQTPHAPPSGAGITAKTTLQGYGITVTTD